MEIIIRGKQGTPFGVTTPKGRTEWGPGGAPGPTKEQSFKGWVPGILAIGVTGQWIG